MLPTPRPPAPVTVYAKTLPVHRRIRHGVPPSSRRLENLFEEDAGILDADVTAGAILAAQRWKVTIFEFWVGSRLSSLAGSRPPSDAKASRPH
jgi:hypothetical protein